MLAIKESTIMPKPYIFKSEVELVKLLRQDATHAAARKFFSEEASSIADVVNTGVAGNTFRAFRNLPVKPSVTFRDWAIDYVQQSLLQLSRLSDAPEYSDYVHKATLSLCDRWRKLTGAEMGYCRGAKLFNLVLKKFACLQSLTEAQKQTLVGLQHVPLDRYTIVGLYSVAPELSIPRNATMKYIESPQQYLSFQKKITDIAQKASVPPIYYDILAWDMFHYG